MGSAMRRTLAVVAVGLVVGSWAVSAQQQSRGRWVTDKYAKLPEPGEEFTNVVVNDKLYLLGGNAAVFTPGARATRPARVQEYDMTADRWTQKKQMPFFADHMLVATQNNKIYIFGGTGMMRQDDMAGTLNGSWEYDPATDAWKTLAAMPTKRTAGAAVAVGGKIYVIGGSTDVAAPDGRNLAAGLVVGTNEVYDPATNRWETKKAMPTPRNHHAIGAINGKIYTIGGRIGANNIGGLVAANTDVVEEYDPATDTWRALNRMPTPRSGHGWAVWQNRIYVVGGEGRDYHMEGVYRDVEVFDPAANEWDKLPPLPTARHGVNVAAFNNRLYVVGGHTVFAGGGGHALDSNLNEVFEFGASR